MTSSGLIHHPPRLPGPSGLSTLSLATRHGIPVNKRTSRPLSLATVSDAALAEEAELEEVDPRTLISSTIEWKPNPSVTRVNAPSNSLPLVILPGFGNCTRDYEEPYGPTDESMAAALRNRGFKVYTVQVERRDWFQVGWSLLSRDYWSGKCTVDPGYRWYLERVQQAVDKARRDCRQDQVHLIGHSAGGWLGRCFIADPLHFNSPAAAPGTPNLGAASLVTLGTPHSAPPPHQARDMTGGALTWTDSQWPGALAATMAMCARSLTRPSRASRSSGGRQHLGRSTARDGGSAQQRAGAYFREQGVRYVCVAGAAVQGDRAAPRRSVQRYAHAAYTQVCGDGHGQVGDVVVPQASAFLQGAERVSLDGVFHSMSKGSRDWPIEHRWYGSEDVLDHWAHFLV